MPASTCLIAAVICHSSNTSTRSTSLFTSFCFGKHHETIGRPDRAYYRCRWWFWPGTDGTVSTCRQLRDLTDLHADALPRSAEAIPQACGSVLGTISADLSTPEGCAALVAAVHGITPRIDILVNNAGLGLGGVVSNVPQAQWND
jgi:hypothetical protein